MQLKMTDWELSDFEAKELPPLSEGEHLLYIQSAMYLPDIDQDGSPVNQKFTITFKSLTKDESSKLTFTLMKNREINRNTYGTLNSLKHALAGPDSGKGILSPGNMEKHVVRATVKMGKPWTGNDGVERVSPNIYHFEPVTMEDYDIASACESVEEQYVKE